MRRVKSWWQRLLDIGTDPADDADLVVRKRTAVAALLALCVAGAVYLVIGLSANRPVVLFFAVLQTAAELLNLAPDHLWEEIVTKQNRALATVVAGLSVAMAIIVAAAIVG